MKVSVIIPVKNGEKTLELCLSKIRTQTLSEIEIIILDSNSLDRSKEIAISYGAKVIDILPESFNHGLTRNLGSQYAKSELIFFTVQDAWISDNKMLEKMSEHFRSIDVMGVVGHQAIPSGELNMNPAFWFKRFTEPQVETRYFPIKNSFNKLNKEKQFELSNWDNVNAMYRKSAIISSPFKKTNFCEDWMWANDALKASMKILRDPSLVVYHYHHMTFTYTFKTNFTINYHFLSFFSQKPKIPWSIFGFLQSIKTLINNKQLSFSKKIYWILHNFLFRLSLFFSALFFRIGYFLGSGTLVEKLYNFFCKQIPQGRIKF